MEITKTNGVIYFTDGDKSTMIPQEILQTAVIEKSGGGINIIYNKGGKDTELNILYSNVTTPVVTSSDDLIAELLIFAQAGTTSGSGALYELLSNKSSSIPTDWNSTDKYPNTKAVKDYVDSAIAGLLDYRGGYDASGDAYPSTGGSGTAGAISKGDTFVISVAGTLGTIDVIVGDIIIAKVDAATDDDADWDVLNIGVSYVPEDSANKVTSVNVNSTDDQYPSAKAMYTALQGKVNNANHALSISGQDLTIVGGNTVTIPSGVTLPSIGKNATGSSDSDANLLALGHNLVNSGGVGRGVLLPQTPNSGDVVVVSTTGNYEITIYSATGSNTNQIITGVQGYNSTSGYSYLKKYSITRYTYIGTTGLWLEEIIEGTQSNLKPKVYKAILTQSGTNAPVATVLNGNDANYLGDLTWQRDVSGTCSTSKTGISNTNTICNTNLRSGNYNNVIVVSPTTNSIVIRNFISNAFSDGFSISITIEYYG